MRNLILLALFSALGWGHTFAQEVTANQTIYRRSSLCLFLMDESKMPKRDTIKEAFITSPIPDKYNDHNIITRCFCPDDMKVTPQDIEAYKASALAGEKAEASAKSGGEGAGTEPKKKSGAGSFLSSMAKSAASSATGGIVDSESKDKYAVCAQKFLNENQVAKQLFSKWFRDSSGNFNMELIKERGRYDASMLDVQTAKSSVKGKGLLEDAGEELIKNTFVVVTRYRYLSKDELVSEIDAAAQLIASQISNPIASAAAKAATLGVKASLGAGYYVRTTSFLFQLNWDQDIANTLYEKLWDNPEAFENSDIFGLKFIGQESAWANVKASIFTKKSESELIRIATINAQDAVLAKLEKKYEVFRVKTPLLSTDPEMLAQIGMKEGLEPGDKFEILEQVIDPETNKTTYKRKGTLKVSKDQIWDNRYMADEERELTGNKQEYTATRFEGSNKGLYPGMFIKQIK